MTARRPTTTVRLSKAGSVGGRNGVQMGRVWARLLGVEHTVVEAVCFDEQADSIVVSV